MKKQKKMQNTNKRRIIIDVAAIIICIAGSAAAFTFFFRDLYGTLTKADEKPVGTIQFKQRTAQRRFNDRVVWDILKTDSPIYNGDVIHTADLSEAMIILEGGEKITLAENSLIHVYYTPEGARIELSGGSVNLTTAENGLKLTLISAGTEVDLSAGSALSAAAAAAGGASVQVLEGGAVLSNASVRINAAAGSALTLNKDGSAEAAPQIAVLSPLPGITLLNPSDEALPVTFSWNTINFQGGETVKLDVSPDRKFSSLAAGINAPASSNSAVCRLANGSYFWRAFPVSGGVENTPGDSVIINKLTIAAASVPRLNAPNNGESFNYRNKPPVIQFRWTDELRETASNEYQITIADNSALDDAFVSARVRSNFYQNAAVENGLWYWQVVPIFNSEAALNLQSAVYSFRLNRNTELPAVQLLTPEDESEIIIDTTDEIRFSWKKIDEASNYNILLADNPRFKNPLINNETSGLFSVWQLNAVRPHEGEYYWQVTAIDSEGARSNTGDIRQFSAKTLASLSPPRIRLLSPADGAAVPSYRSVQDAPVLSWAAETKAEKIRLILGTNPNPRADAENGKAILDINTQGRTLLGLPYLKEGLYYWTIEAETIDGKDISPPSPFSFRITPVNIAPAENLRPQSGYKIGPPQLREDRSLRLSWNVVSGANAYIFTLRRADNDAMLTTEILYRNTWTVSNLASLGNGRFNWQIEGIIIDAAGLITARGRPAMSNFVIDVPTPENAEIVPPNAPFYGRQ
ncbi:hypothetical protein FACS189494_03360 [Spirochaetia bacterium]|nr:hypothetical protein FACS189494_03360 [Spirochaetia bacterium]